MLALVAKSGLTHVHHVVLVTHLIVEILAPPLDVNYYRITHPLSSRVSINQIPLKVLLPIYPSDMLYSMRSTMLLQACRNVVTSMIQCQLQWRPTVVVLGVYNRAVLNQ
jgi:hypothetical protein